MIKESIDKLRKKFIAANEGNSTLTLKAVYGKQQGPTDICPVYDSVAQRFLGVEELNEEEKRKSVRPVSGDTTRRLEDGLIIDFSRDVDVVDWAWMKHCDQLAMNREEADMSNAALFYVYNEEKLVKERVKSTDKIFEALTFIKKASQTELAQRCRLILGNTSGLKPLDIEDYMKDTAMKNPDLIIKIFSDENFKTRLFVHELLDAKILRKDAKSKVYFYNDKALGASEEAVVEFLNDPANQESVAIFKLELEAKK